MIKKIRDNFYKQLNRLRLSNDGIAIIEFAFAAPILILLFIGGIEVARALIITQRLQNTTTSVADATAQIDTRNLPVAYFIKPNPNTGTLGYMDVVFQASVGMMGNYGGTEIDVSDFSYPIGSGGAQINWNCWTRYTYTGSNNSTTRLSIAGNAIQFKDSSGNIINTLTMSPGDEVIISEGFFHYSPVIQNFDPMQAYVFYNTAVYPLRFSVTLSNYVTTGQDLAGTYGKCGYGNAVP